MSRDVPGTTAGAVAVANGVVEFLPGPGDLAYTFGGRPAVATLKPGTVLRTTTEDCFAGRVRSAADLPSQVCDFAELNPVTGPFHVAGAEPGDVLAVHVIDISPARPWGVSATFPHFGALTSTHLTATLQPPLPEKVWVYRLDDATARYEALASEHALDLPLDPMIGTLGVAPAGGEVRPTTVNGLHGGNIDTPLLRAGTTVFLPVNVPGALFALGDGHARQGEGEACGTGIECAMQVTLVVDVVKGVSIPGPRLQTDTHIGSIGCARPLEDAYRIAHTDLTGWLAELTGLDVLDAYQLVSQAGTAPIGNVCDSDYSVIAALPSAVPAGLGAGPVLDGVRDRMLRSPTGG
jgi:acetamidase/formamidase